MTPIIKRVLVSCLVACFPSLLWWAGGYNFDTRGELAFWLVFCTFFTFILVVTCPLLDD